MEVHLKNKNKITYFCLTWKIGERQFHVVAMVWIIQKKRLSSKGKDLRIGVKTQFTKKRKEKELTNKQKPMLSFSSKQRNKIKSRFFNHQIDKHLNTVTFTVGYRWSKLVPSFIVGVCINYYSFFMRKNLLVQTLYAYFLTR